MKLRTISHIVDRGVNQLDTDVFDYPNQTNFIEMFKQHLIDEEEHNEETLTEVFDMLESGKWVGGEWSREGVEQIKFESDVSEIVYKVED